MAKANEKNYLVATESRDLDKEFFTQEQDEIIIAMKERDCTIKQITAKLNEKFGTDRSIYSVRARVLNVLRYLHNTSEYNYKLHRVSLSRLEFQKRKKEVAGK